jgi:hypothetical protein
MKIEDLALGLDPKNRAKQPTAPARSSAPRLMPHV